MSVTTINERPEPRSAWSKLRHTPMRDLVRGRLTGRLDIDTAVDVELPPALARLVRQVSRRTRLWRMEKVDVARELSAHFADGLAFGEHAAALEASFGDPVRAARLIRRAKRRGRSVVWHAFRYARGAFVAIVLLYLLLGVRFLLGRPDPSTDYLASVNAVAAAVPPDERAWPLYRTALLQGERPNELLVAFNRPPRPGEEGWEDVEAYLDRNEAMLGLLRQARKRSGLGFLASGAIFDPEDAELWPELGAAKVTPESRMLINCLLPHLAELRQLGRILTLDMQRASVQGDGARVMIDLEALIAASRHARELPFIINDLVGRSMLSMALETTGAILASRPDALDDSQLVGLVHRLSDVDDILIPRYDGERMGFEDIIQWLYTDDGNGDGRFTLKGARLMTMWSSGSVVPADDLLVGLSLPALEVLILGRREMLAEYQRLIDLHEIEARTPLWERGESAVDRQINAWCDSRVEEIRHLPIVLMMPALGKASMQAEKIAAERDAIRVAACLVLHRRRRGAWPETLDDLVPGILPSVPPDRFDGKPMRYVVAETGPRLYSVGTNRIDDGGTVGRFARYDDASQWWSPARLEAAAAGGATYLPRVPESDWVLWPRTPQLPVERRYGATPGS